MTNPSTTAELFELAIATERAAETLYRELVTRFAHHQDAARFWEGYAAEETAHTRWLERLRDEMSPEQMAVPADPEMLRDAREMVRFSVEDALANVRNLEDAYQLANQLEHSETNVIFEFLISNFAEDQEIVSFLRSQLRDHIAALTTRFPTQLKSAVIRQAIEVQDHE